MHERKELQQRNAHLPQAPNSLAELQGEENKSKDVQDLPMAHTL